MHFAQYYRPASGTVAKSKCQNLPESHPHMLIAFFA